MTKQEEQICSLCRETHLPGSTWPSTPEAPIGDYPAHWADGMHLEDGHALWECTEDRAGEDIVRGELSALVIQDGFEYATMMYPALIWICFSY